MSVVLEPSPTKLVGVSENDGTATNETTELGAGNAKLSAEEEEEAAVGRALAT